MPSLVDNDLAERIRKTPDPDQATDWPSDRLGCLRDAGVFRWGLPVEFGGLPVTVPQMLEGYIELARLCLTTAFILTQRDAACHRIANSENLALRQKLLPDHCAGRALATVGISHLSTSRQHWSRPSVIARRTEDGFELTGEAPWVTGARHADLLVTGATIDYNQQILVAIPKTRTGVNIGEPLKLMALNASCTGSVNLDRVAVSTEEIVVGPAPQVLKVDGKGGTGSLTTTAVAIGTAQQTLDGLRGESDSRPELAETVDSLCTEHASLRDDLLAAAIRLSQGSMPQGAVEQLRQRANSIASRAALAYVCSAKGAGFISGHPAERSLREAMFFQVWSCPPAVTKATLDQLAHR
jgi:alkylation response protein AidB-like acyl-CoA dehydrogenase